GMLISYIVDYILKGLPNQITWRLMLGFACIPAIILYLGVMKLPESPRYLIKNGRPDEARKVMSYVRSSEGEINNEVNQIKETAHKEQEAQKTSWSALFSEKYRYLVIAGVGVAAFQQFQGANAIFYYIPLIVQKATGQAATSALMWPIIQGVILVIGSLVFMWIAEKFNRCT
ncbi:MFS transporter, partial [Oenococcus oeni]|uniref:MFS transporter n=1 Tax=Oenococcus oeni TaxID=1247 RepID=UPI000A8DF218